MKLRLYEIRLCKKEEYDKLIDFIRDHWKKDHIFTISKELFEFQHGDASAGYYDFVVAIHKETQEIHAVLGFIRTSLYDGINDTAPQAVYGALWKVRDDIRNKEIGKLGLGALYHLIKRFPDSAYITLGLSQFSQEIYQALHFGFGEMGQYYVANSNMRDFFIAKNPMVETVQPNQDICIKKLDNAEDIPNDFYPDKNAEYIRKRYLYHPIYTYDLYGVYREGSLVSEWVIRPVKVGKAVCLRLVDIIGTIRGLDHISGNIVDLLNECHAEYIDCYNYGIEPYEFEQMGFRKLEKKGDAVIPNYFEPFEQRNTVIHYAYMSKKPIVIFKGDADQDRPNRIDAGLSHLRLP